MARRQREWARRIRDALRTTLGGRCSICQTLDNLHFDCVVPQGKLHHRDFDWSQRMSFYLAQHAEGNLRLLCVACNGRKGATEDKHYHLAKRSVMMQ